MNIAILASHNGSGFDAIYEAIEQKTLAANIVLLISNNHDSKAIQKAKSRNIQTYIVNAKSDADPDAKILKLLLESQCDTVFLSGYMKKLSKTITEKFTILNSHPSLLPKYGGRGMYGHYVHEAVIAHGEKESGVTIHTVNDVYDEGEIILQKSLSITENETALSLERKIKELEKRAIIQALTQLIGKNIS